MMMIIIIIMMMIIITKIIIIIIKGKKNFCERNFECSSFAVGQFSEAASLCLRKGWRVCITVKNKLAFTRKYRSFPSLPSDPPSAPPPFISWYFLLNILSFGIFQLYRKQKTITKNTNSTTLLFFTKSYTLQFIETPDSEFLNFKKSLDKINIIMYSHILSHSNTSPLT